MKTVIIGGGAAGMAAAVAAAECGDRVTVLERMDRVGKKLLATGNGRCNLMNTGTLRYPGGGNFAAEVLARCGKAEQKRFWQAHGLYLREEDGGRVYPACGQASAVLDTLRLAMENAGVDVRTGQDVTAIEKAGQRWQVVTPSETIRCDRVIVAGGGCAQPKLGSNGSCYGLLAALGHDCGKTSPALTQIETDTAPIRGLSGIRVKCGVAVECRGQTLHSETGEALFTDYGVSGVCAMQCARYARQGCEITLDLLQGLELGKNAEAALRAALRMRRKSWASQPMDALLTGLFVPRLSLAIGKAAGVQYKDRAIGTLTDAEIGRLAQVMRRFALPVKGVKGYETAQVTSGGADTALFDPITLESRVAPGLHAAGEVLDVDGDCGGFNLMFAFGSGILAGINGRSYPPMMENGGNGYDDC